MLAWEFEDLAVPPTHCVTLDKSLDLLGLSFLVLKGNEGSRLDDLQGSFQPYASSLLGAGIWGLDLSQHPANPRDFLEAIERPGQLLQGVACP